jgi:hypothetical protein
LLKFQEQETHTDFAYMARNDVKKIFSTKQEFELVEFFKTAEKLHYGLTKKEALKLAFQFGNENGVVMQNVLVHLSQRSEETSRVLVFEKT